MDAPHALDVHRQGFGHLSGEDRHPVLSTLAITHGDLVPLEIEVLDPEPGALEETQTRAIHQRHHQPWRTAQVAEDGDHLLAREHDRNADGGLGADGVEANQLAAEHFSVQEDQRGQRLVLRTSADPITRGERGEELSDLRFAHLVGGSLVVEGHEAADPS